MKKPQAKAEQLNFEIGFYEALRERLPEDLELLKLLADNYTKAGRWEDGLVVDVELARLMPQDFMVHYNLACSYSLMGRLKDSANSLMRAIQLGYSDWHWMREDSDLDNLRKSPEFAPVHEVLQAKTKGLGRE